MLMLSECWDLSSTAIIRYLTMAGQLTEVGEQTVFQSYSTTCMLSRTGKVIPLGSWYFVIIMDMFTDSVL
jgi:hypothetical protein